MLTISQLLRYAWAADHHAARYVNVHAWRGFRRRNGTHGIQIITITRPQQRSERSHRHQIEIGTALKNWPGNISDRGCPVLFSCNCERWLFYYEWVAHRHGAAEIIYGNGEPPYITNPTFRIGICKHGICGLEYVQHYHL